jgi:hypothetical protein
MTLIEKLKALTPTEGEWENNEDPDFPYVNIGGSALDTDYIMPDDAELISLAPQMRQELIRMDEEIREQKNKIDCLVGYLEKWNSQKSNWLAGVPDELDNVIKEAKECLHVTPPKTNP